MQTTSTTDAGAARLGPVRLRSAEEVHAAADAWAREKAERLERGQQLHAKIKRTSRYYGQGAPGALFKVFIDVHQGDYVVQGGPGGQYRLADVNLYVKGDDGRELKIS